MASITLLSMLELYLANRNAKGAVVIAQTISAPLLPVAGPSCLYIPFGYRPLKYASCLKSLFPFLNTMLNKSFGPWGE